MYVYRYRGGGFIYTYTNTRRDAAAAAAKGPPDGALASLFTPRRRDRDREGVQAAAAVERAIICLN